MKVTKQMGTHELLARRFKSDLRKLKKLVAELGVKLHSYDLAEPSDICILSNSDVEKLEHKLRCQSSNENYFISQNDYDEHEEFHSFVDDQI